MIPKWAIEREHDRRMAKPMRRPISLALQNGSTVRVDGEEILQRAIALLTRVHHAGANYRDGERACAMDVMSALLEFTRSLDIFDHSTAARVPMAMMVALEDLDRGFTPLLLQKKNPPRTARQSRREWYLKACAAGCLEVLIAAGIDDNEAKLYIAEILGRTDFRLGRIETPGANVVADWRKRFRENDNVARGDVEAFWQTIQTQRADAAESPQRLKGRIELLLLHMLALNGYQRKGTIP